MKRLSIILSFAMALLLAGCSNGPDAIAAEFAQAAYSGKTAEAVEHLDPNIVRLGGPKLMAAMAQAGKRAAAEGGLVDVRTFDARVEGDAATVQVEKTFGNGSKKTESMKLRRVDGAWYVTM